MRYLLLVIALAWSLTLQADVIARSTSGDSITLHAGQCTNYLVVQQMSKNAQRRGASEDQIAKFIATTRAATGIKNGVKVAICWSLIDGLVYFLDETGDGGILPEEVFEKLPPPSES